MPCWTSLLTYADDPIGRLRAFSNTPSAQKPETAPPRSSVVRLSLSNPLLRPVEACLYPARELNVWPVHRLAAGCRVAHVEVQPIACAPPIPVSSRRLAPRAAGSLLRRVSLPYILQCQGQRLCLHAAVAVHSVLRKDKLVRIPLGGQSLDHALIGQDPVVIVVAGNENVSIADVHPDAQRLLRAVGN